MIVIRNPGIIAARAYSFGLTVNLENINEPTSSEMMMDIYK